jgi:endonuclease/exonuclease/phosphatase family metal-dependent hydrolase
VRARWAWIAIPIALWALKASWRHRRDPLRVATFNIEKFPKDDRQVDGALDEIATTAASVIAVQEIGDEDVLRTRAQQRLGRTWQFVTDGSARFALGVLYDTSLWQLRSRRVYDDTRVDGRQKGVLEVRLAPLAGGDLLRVLVVHFRSGTSGRTWRERQFEGLEHVVAAARDSGERLIVLGDFNATETADRDDLASLAANTNLTWASEPLRCTAFWARDDGCPRSRLDHILTSTPPSSITATGACATHGCDWQASCPLYARQVSDHCPVVVTF